MALEDHPGFFGITSRGVIAIHANWPAYPFEHGWQIALMNLGCYPHGTTFEVVDDIDRCVLLLAGQYGRYEDPHDERSFHAAIWHEDLIDAAESGFVDGVQGLTHREYEERKRDDMRRELLRSFERQGVPVPEDDVLDHLGAVIDGNWVPMRLPPLDEYDECVDPEDEPRTWLGVDSAGVITLTAAGWERLDELWADALTVPDSIRSRVEPLVELGLYDSALREVGVMIESRLRRLTGSQAYGIRLVDEFLKEPARQGALYNTGAKILRSELRTAFKFVRNEFAHNIVDLPRPRAMSLLGRMCHALAEVEAFDMPGPEPT